MELNFNEPPEQLRGRNATGANIMREFLDELAKHPNRWAEYPMKIRSSSFHARYRRANPEYEFRIAINQITEKGKEWTLFVRFIGEE